MARKTDRMSAQNRTLGHFSKTIAQSGSYSENKPQTLAEQMKSYGSPKLNEVVNDEDKLFAKMNSTTGVAFRAKK